jgi:hypothetical protein
MEILPVVRAAARVAQRTNDEDLYPRRTSLGKPSIAMAVFPLERYTGALARDLFADEESTYFDDVEQFIAFQHQAADETAEQYRQAGTAIEVIEGSVRRLRRGSLFRIRLLGAAPCAVRSGPRQWVVDCRARSSG